MGYSLIEAVPTPSSGHSVHFLSSNSERLPPTPPSPLPSTSDDNTDVSSSFNSPSHLNMGKTGENKDKEEDPSQQNKLHRLLGQDDLTIIEYEEVPVIPADAGENMADFG